MSLLIGPCSCTMMWVPTPLPPIGRSSDGIMFCHLSFFLEHPGEQAGVRQIVCTIILYNGQQNVFGNQRNATVPQRKRQNSKPVDQGPSKKRKPSAGIGHEFNLLAPTLQSLQYLIVLNFRKDAEVDSDQQKGIKHEACVVIYGCIVTVLNPTTVLDPREHPFEIRPGAA